MGNLFIGFPVPRAKIAEMIEGAAPPLKHKDNHLPDGSDALFPANGDASGKILRWTGSAFEWIAAPSAGAPFPFDGINIGATFEDYQAYDLIGSAGTEYYLDKDGLTLHWTSGSSAIISCTRKLFADDPISLWTKNQRLDVALRAWSATPAENESYCIRGKSDDNCFGFFSCSGDLLGIIGNLEEGYAEVGLLTADQWIGHAKILSARLYPDTFNCKFYVNGVYIDEVTSEQCFPTGSDYLDQVFYMDLSADNVNDYTICNYWNFWQGA